MHMHPALMSWWRFQRAFAHCGDRGGWAYCRPEGRPWGSGPAEEEFEGGGGFGVRRPLRFLAHKLDLDERQIAELAPFSAKLKPKAAQPELTHPRPISPFATPLPGKAFNPAKPRKAAQLPVRPPSGRSDPFLRT